MKGMYVIARGTQTGVWAGVLKDHDGPNVELTDARRLWRWHAKVGVSLSGVAVAGLYDDSTVEPPVGLVRLTEICELLQCTPEAETSIREL